jgi:aspartate kinase
MVQDAVEAGTQAVSGIASDETQARIAITSVPDTPGVAGRIFGSLAQHNISVDMIIQSLNRENGVNDIAFTVSSNDLHAAMTLLEQVKADIGAASVVADTDVAKVSIVGIGMIDRPGIAADMFSALAEAGINIKMIATSEIKISCLIERAQAKAAVAAIHGVFFPQDVGEPVVLADQKLGY